MRAIIQDEWDGPDSVRLAETPEPRPAPTEVKVRVHAAGVNPVDYYTSRGLAYNRMLELPFIHGWDVAGWSRRSATVSADFRRAIASSACPGFRGRRAATPSSSPHRRATSRQSQPD